MLDWLKNMFAYTDARELRLDEWDRPIYGRYPGFFYPYAPDRYMHGGWGPGGSKEDALGGTREASRADVGGNGDDVARRSGGGPHDHHGGPHRHLAGAMGRSTKMDAPPSVEEAGKGTRSLDSVRYRTRDWHIGAKSGTYQQTPQELIQVRGDGMQVLVSDSERRAYSGTSERAWNPGLGATVRREPADADACRSTR